MCCWTMPYPGEKVAPLQQPSVVQFHQQQPGKAGATAAPLAANTSAPGPDRTAPSLAVGLGGPAPTPGTALPGPPKVLVRLERPKQQQDPQQPGAATGASALPPSCPLVSVPLARRVLPWPALSCAPGIPPCSRSPGRHSSPRARTGFLPRPLKCPST